MRMFHILQRKFHSGEWILQKPSGKGNDTLVGIAKEYENNQNSVPFKFFFSLVTKHKTILKALRYVELISFQKRTLPANNSGTTKWEMNDSSAAGGI